jgi:hypothetical protein
VIDFSDLFTYYSYYSKTSTSFLCVLI